MVQDWKAEDPEGAALSMDRHAELQADLLLVDDDPSAIQVLSRVLGAFAHRRFATSGPDALRIARESRPDLVLLDAEMPGMSGFEVCQELKRDPAFADVPVIFVTSHHDVDAELRGLACGAVDFIAKPVCGPLVMARVLTHVRLKRLADALRHFASIDGLTGLDNRRSFDEALLREVGRAQRSGLPLSLLMIDVDHFKRFNDHYGHPAGDQCLRQFAHLLQCLAQRPCDLAARYGGEEMVLLLPETDAVGAHGLANRFLRQIDALRVPHAASETADHVTVSIGVASFLAAGEAAQAEGRTGIASSVDEDAAAHLVAAADRALYAAKAKGRARVVVDETAASPGRPLVGCRE